MLICLSRRFCPAQEKFTNRSAACKAIRKAVSRLVTESRQYPILIFDEAHHLHNEILEELRLLTNYRMDSGHRLCLLLVGLTEPGRRLAGSDAGIFEREAVEAVALASNGLPRRIDRIAHYALYAAALEGSRTVSITHVEHASRELAP